MATRNMKSELKNILIYSGHCEIVGGDVKYIVDLINYLQGDGYKIKLITDKYCEFQKLSDKWLTKPLEIEYIDTVPVLFKKNIWTRLSEKIPLLDKFLQLKSGSISLMRLASLVTRILSFEPVRFRIKNYKVMKQMLEKHKKSYDIFWFNNGGYPGKEAGIIGSILARKMGFEKVVMTFHNMPSAPSWKRPFQTWLDHKLITSLTDVIAVSKTCKDELAIKRQFPKDMIHVIYCGLEDMSPLSKELSKNKKAELGIREEEKIILMTGNLDQPRKGHAYLFEAMSKVVKDIPESKLLVVGGGSEEGANELEALINKLGLQESIKMLGHRFDINDINSISDLAVIPSFEFEATPYTIKEAMRVSKPAVSTSAGGCFEAIIDHVTGLVVPPKNSDALADAIIEILKNPEMAREMGKKGRKFYLDNFEMNEQVKKHRAVFS